MDYELFRDIYVAGGMTALCAALDGVAPKDRAEAVIAAARAVGDVGARDLARSHEEAEGRRVDLAYWKIVMPLADGTD
ncbi:hypothetical protein OG402_41010 [Streptomyces anulatus]|uniref:hypothetical protein n=1 Tax=Streptomyces TaxID=1883 RepID=UPI00117C135B|nr:MULTISPECIES: hypothetical protein [Streptomyces]MCX4606809.1 hypothetical protein [Streptomyces anulatus]